MIVLCVSSLIEVSQGGFFIYNNRKIILRF